MGKEILIELPGDFKEKITYVIEDALAESMSKIIKNGTIMPSSTSASMEFYTSDVEIDGECASKKFDLFEEMTRFLKTFDFTMDDLHAIAANYNELAEKIELEIFSKIDRKEYIP